MRRHLRPHKQRKGTSGHAARIGVANMPTSWQCLIIGNSYHLYLYAVHLKGLRDGLQRGQIDFIQVWDVHRWPELDFKHGKPVIHGATWHPWADVSPVRVLSALRGCRGPMITATPFRQHSLGDDVKRILFSAGKGGVGKTTMCRNLAAAAAHSGLKVVTADLDPQATLTIWSRRRPNTVPVIPHFKVGWAEVDALLDDSELEGYDALFIDTPPSIETQPAAF